MPLAVVTGGCGFIGSHLIRLLIKKYNFKVLNIDKLTYASNPSNLDEIKNSQNYSFIQHDICDQNEIYEYIRSFKPDVIFHLAAESHVDNSIESANPFIKTNIEGTFTLLEVTKKLLDENFLPENFRFIHVSTDEVYGSLNFDALPANEISAYNPSSPYSATKAASDLLVKAWIKTHDFPAIITHCTNNYGESQHEEKFIPTLIRCAIQNKPIPIYGTGENIRDWLYVKDHCEALYAVFRHGKISQTYNISSTEEWSNLRVAEQVCKYLDELSPRADSKSFLEQILHVTDRPGHDLRYSLCNQKTKQQLFWSPQLTFLKGLKITIQWYLKKYQKVKPSFFNKPTQLEQLV